jgi:hypothetical protein
MQFITQTPKEALSTFPKQPLLRADIITFKANLVALLDKISVIEKRTIDESEEHLKNGGSWHLLLESKVSSC